MKRNTHTHRLRDNIDGNLPIYIHTATVHGAHVMLTETISNFRRVYFSLAVNYTQLWLGEMLLLCATFLFFNEMSEFVWMPVNFLMIQSQHIQQQQQQQQKFAFIHVDLLISHSLILPLFNVFQPFAPHMDRYEKMKLSMAWLGMACTRIHTRIVHSWNRECVHVFLGSPSSALLSQFSTLTYTHI